MRKITQLSNKIRVVTNHLRDRNSASIGIWYATGGRYEQDTNKGVAHFIEHMAFKGSQKYSCEQVKQQVEGVGGALNAFTGEEETCYYAKVPARYLEHTFDILSDISAFPSLTLKDMQKEKTVILEEIKMYHDLPQYYVSELLEALLWPDHPLGKSLAGSMESVGDMGIADLRNFHGRYYSPQNMVIAACGQLNHDDLVDLTSKKFKGLIATPERTYLPARKDQLRPSMNLHYKATEQMHLALGYLAYESNHPDYYALAMLSIILGGNMSSRLFNEVREKRGLAYSVSSGLKSLDDTGVFVVRAGVDNAKIVDAVALILKVLTGISKGIKPDEFKRAKDYYIGQFSLGLEDTMDHMIWMGSVVLSNDQAKTSKQVIEKISNVTVSDVMRVAKEVLDRRRVNVAIIGPLTESQQKQLKTLIDNG